MAKYRTGRGMGLVAAALAASVLLAACNGGGGAGGTQTPTASSSPQASGTAFPRATVTGNHVDDPMGYSADTPTGWNVYDNNIVAGKLVTDIFFAPETRDDVTPNLAVSCDVLTKPVTLDDFMREHEATAKGLNASGYAATQGHKVDTRDAGYVTYGLRRGAVTLRKSEYVFVSGDCAWIVALTLPASDPPESDKILDEFVASLKVTR